VRLCRLNLLSPTGTRLPARSHQRDDVCQNEASIRSRTGSLDAASVATCLSGMANSRKEIGEHGK
jgi:hypothetical protein